MTRTRIDRAVERARALLLHPRVPFAAAAIAIVLSLPTLFYGLQVDDYFHRAILLSVEAFASLQKGHLELFTFFDGDPVRTHWLMDHGFGPWWANPTVRLAFFRPVTALTHMLDYRLWPDAPALMHAQSIAWYGAVVLLAAKLYRRLLGATLAGGLAALMYAVDHAHGLPVGWIANRNTLVATTFGLLALLLHDRARRDGAKLAYFLAPIALLVALFAGEAATGTLAYLLAYAACLDRGSRRARAASLLPHVAAATTWAFVYRHFGYGAHGSGMYLDPGADPVRFAAAAAVRGPILLAGELGLQPPDFFAFVGAPMRAAMLAVALVTVAVAALAFTPLLRRSAEARFFALGAAIAVIPGCATFPAHRLLYLVGFGALGLLAQLVAALLDRDPSLPERGARRVVTRVFAYVVGGAHLLLSPILLPLTAYQMVIVGQVVDGLVDDLPNDAALETQRLVVLNPPDASALGYLPLLATLRGRHAPERTLALSIGTDATDFARIDARTLVVRPDHGFIQGTLDTLMRDTRDVIPVGARIELTGVEIEVTAATDDLRPAEATFRFAAPLEDPSLRFSCWQQGHLVPIAMPAVGAHLRLEAQSLLP